MQKVYTQPRPLPKPAPKPGHYSHSKELTDAEAADLFRQFIAKELEKRKHQEAIFKINREQEAILAQAKRGINGAYSNDICQLCGFIHSGEC